MTKQELQNKWNEFRKSNQPAWETVPDEMVVIFVAGLLKETKFISYSELETLLEAQKKEHQKELEEQRARADDHYASCIAGLIDKIRLEREKSNGRLNTNKIIDIIKTTN